MTTVATKRQAEPPSLLLLPGLLCDDFVWQAPVRDLDWPRVVAVAGYGGASSIGKMAGGVLGSAPERFALAGHSMGGRVALEVLRRAPDRVDRIALLDTGVHPRQAGERAKRMALLALGREQGIEALVDAWLPPMVHAQRRGDDAFMRPLREMCIKAGLQQFEDQVTALLDRPDARPQLRDINCPALVAVGRQDEWSPPDQHETIAAAIPHARLVVFEESGHMSPVEAPDAVTAALQTWLDE